MRPPPYARAVKETKTSGTIGSTAANRNAVNCCLSGRSSVEVDRPSFPREHAGQEPGTAPCPRGGDERRTRHHVDAAVVDEPLVQRVRDRVGGSDERAASQSATPDRR